MKKIKFLAALCCLCAVMFMSCTTGTENGHEWVDLGLPSGTKWATCNVGATKPEEYGDYFAWGETEPKTNYYSGTYKWVTFTYYTEYDSWNLETLTIKLYNFLICGSRVLETETKYNIANLLRVIFHGGSSYLETLTKYNTDADYGTVDNKITLELADDAARANWGGAWRMPTDDEWTELRENCTLTWTDDYNGTGVKGRIVTSNINGNSIFLPAAGYRGYGNLSYAGSNGYYWSSSLGSSDPSRALHEDFGLRSWYGSDGSRSDGLSVRPVLFVREAEEKAHITEQEKTAGTKNTNEENHTNSVEESYAQVSRTQERTTSTSNDQRDAVTFRHESDVHRYLQTNRFVGEDNGTRITIYERSDMLLSANNVPITNAIRVVEFTGTRAFVRATSPYSSGSMEFLVDATEGYIYYVQDRQYFFKK